MGLLAQLWSERGFWGRSHQRGLALLGSLWVFREAWPASGPRWPLLQKRRWGAWEASLLLGLGLRLLIKDHPWVLRLGLAKRA